MNSFISEVATSLYQQYGDNISSLRVVFPSRRARLFFCDELARIALRPTWQPRFESLGEIMEQIAEVKCSDHIKLVTELFKVYSKYHKESFDTFYFWGEMLLSDFDQIDKYMIDADMLFSNIEDLHDIEDNFSYLTPEQRDVISKFWSNFSSGVAFSSEKEHFITIWRTLGKIYHEFRSALESQGIAYEGMVHKLAIEKISSGGVKLQLADDEHYAIIGFNALSECEKRLFSWLQRGGKADFYWDYDNYYVGNPEHEAGMFLRENISQFPAKHLPQTSFNHFLEAKEMTVVSSPSDPLQCKYVHTFLQQLLDQSLDPGKETAIVLTDESLLIPVLYSIPEGISKVNVTMGYPLRQTTAYSFIERLIELQKRKKQSKNSSAFHHSDVLGLLNHPYILESHASIADKITADIQRKQSSYVSDKAFGEDSFLADLFSPIVSWGELSAYLKRALAHIGRNSSTEDDIKQRREFFTIIIDNINKVENALKDSNLEVTTAIFSSLLRKVLQGLRIPYRGEPLEGVQIMGILETRNLDFENVLILSVNDDTFPGNRAITSSFVPHNLRVAYGLPTPQHHEGVFAYYFYRLLQRAQRCDIVYCSKSDEKQTGEPSRYIYQLQYESAHKITTKSIPLNVNLSQSSEIVIRKEGPVAEKLFELLDNPLRSLSPTSFYTYIECPLKFYFRNIARLSTPDEIEEGIDLPMFGTILHKAMEILYTPLIEIVDPRKQIGKLIGSKSVEQAVNTAIEQEYLRSDKSTPEDWSGNVIIVRDIVCRYINGSVLPFDSSHEMFTITSLENRISTSFCFEIDGDKHEIIFSGLADRIDTLQDGVIRIVDYKTGSQHREFISIEALFADDVAQRSSAVLQTLLYSLMVTHTEKTEVQPALYYVRFMNSTDFSPLLVEGKEEVTAFSKYRLELESKLRSTLVEIFDRATPFSQCNNPKVCQYCDYRAVCRR